MTSRPATWDGQPKVPSAEAGMWLQPEQQSVRGVADFPMLRGGPLRSGAAARGLPSVTAPTARRPEGGDRGEAKLIPARTGDHPTV